MDTANAMKEDANSARCFTYSRLTRATGTALQSGQHAGTTGQGVTMRKPAEIRVDLDLKLIKIGGTWKPNEEERRAAWELYVELVTRVAAVPLQNGLLREALSSTYAVFDRTRGILREHGPSVAAPKPDGQYNFGYLAIAYLNFTLRPFLSKWHPALEEWEEQRPPGVSRLEHERAWTEHDALREDIALVTAQSRQFVTILGGACRIPDLLDAVPT